MLVDALPDDMDLTIATNAVDIAAAIMQRPDIQLIVVGGAIDPAVSAIDAAAVEAVSRLPRSITVSSAFAACRQLTPSKDRLHV